MGALVSKTLLKELQVTQRQ